MRTTYQSHKMNFKFFLSNYGTLLFLSNMERFYFYQMWNVSVAFLIWTRLFLLNTERFWVFCISVVVFAGVCGVVFFCWFFFFCFFLFFQYGTFLSICLYMFHYGCQSRLKYFVHACSLHGKITSVKIIL